MRPLSAADFERLLARVLHGGAITSTVFLSAGLVLTLLQPHAWAASMLTTVGLVILMATPVARVVASVFGYASERDWTFFALTLVVLLVLSGSLLIALIH
jgi:uncharacterized membrane protein